MTTKPIIIILFLLIFTPILASNAEQFISENIINNPILEPSKSIFIHLQSSISNDINILLIQQHFLENNFLVVENELFADYIVTIFVEESLINKNTRKVVIKNDIYLELKFLVRITNAENEQVLAINEYVYETKKEIDKEESKWYTPVLTTFVIGSLVYLLFYGN